MEKLTKKILEYIDLNQEEMTEVLSYFFFQEFKQGEFWIKKDMICDEVAFIESGLLRIFYFDSLDVEVNCYFALENCFVSAFTSFIKEEPTIEYIQALQASKLWIIHKADLEAISLKIPKIQIWRRKVAEEYFTILENRINMLQSQSASERYEMLLKNEKEVIQQVPLQMIASYLGISPQHLSRLRRQK